MKRNGTIKCLSIGEGKFSVVFKATRVSDGS